MAHVFFPSCKAKADYPVASEKLKAYVNKKFDIDPIGCCRVHHKKLTPNDTALVVCNNCAAIIEESGNPGTLKFIWSVIDQDSDFPFPDYHGEPISIQDCWIAYEKRELQDTVRSLLKKMHLTVHELAEHHAETRFCGVNLLSPCTPSNAKLAPKRYVQNGAHMFTPCSETEQIARFQAHCAGISTEQVACYCKFCRDAINMGGKRGVHILQLLFPDYAENTKCLR
ncbi:MAG: hypothetical protein IJU76_03805 [Desulfovibrionaceae bacterium]|nr:hypothetical protein [Desulfovibrionaceae bacterium]